VDGSWKREGKGEGEREGLMHSAMVSWALSTSPCFPLLLGLHQQLLDLICDGRYPVAVGLGLVALAGCPSPDAPGPA